MYTIEEDMVVLDTSTAAQLFRRLGCERVDSWADDILVRRLEHLSVLRDTLVEYGELSELADVLMNEQCAIVLRNDEKQTSQRIPLSERCYVSARKKPAKRTRRKRKRGACFSFHACGIPSGATLVLRKDPSISCVVVGDPWEVDFGDDISMPLTNRTKQLIGAKDSTYLSPMYYWMYQGKPLSWYYKQHQK